MSTLFETIFHNTGNKMQVIAKIIVFFGLLYIPAGIITEFVLEFTFCGLFILSGIIVCVTTIISALPWYALGDVYNELNSSKKTSTVSANTTIKVEPLSVEPIFKDDSFQVTKHTQRTGYWKCTSCGKTNPAYVGTCSCGQSK